MTGLFARSTLSTAWRLPSSIAGSPSMTRAVVHHRMSSGSVNAVMPARGGPHVTSSAVRSGADSLPAAARAGRPSSWARCLRGRRETEQSRSAFRCPDRDLLEGDSADACDFLGDERDVGGLVALPAVGDGREIRTVGLKEKATHRRGADGTAVGFSPSRTTSCV
jgi:hypothetical protein